MSAASAGMISELTAKPARNNFLMTDILPVGNGKRMRLLPPVVTRWSHGRKNEGLPEEAGSRSARNSDTRRGLDRLGAGPPIGPRRKTGRALPCDGRSPPAIVERPDLGNVAIDLKHGVVPEQLHPTVYNDLAPILAHVPLPAGPIPLISKL
jgi:hypothetical protein